VKIQEPEPTGQGYALEACRAVLAHGERVLGLPTVIAIVNPANERSTSLRERLGFKGAGTVTLPPPHAPEPVALYRRVR
jgi:RimJ/RimL family protein N-acetyltransferase